MPLRGAFGWVLFGVIWAAAVTGIVLNSIDLEKFRKPSVVCYLMMGWAVVFAVKPMLRTVNSLSLVFLLIGGLFYTVGIFFYVMKKKRYFHSIWHLFTSCLIVNGRRLFFAARESAVTADRLQYQTY